MYLSSVHHSTGYACRLSRLTHSRAAQIFSNAASAGLVATARSACSIPTLNGLPEIIVTGRANCGKSTLLNAVLGRKALLPTSKKAGRTRQLDFFRVGVEPGKLIVVDAPGYGARGRPEWGEIFDKYLETRNELRRVYILFNAKHSLNTSDTLMLAHLSEMLASPCRVQPFTLQSVITKADTIPVDMLEDAIDRIRKVISQVASLCLPPIITSSHMKPPFGIDVLRENIANACHICY